MLLVIFIIIVLLILLFLWMSMVWVQRKVLYQPSRIHKWVPPFEHEDFYVKGLHVWYFGNFAQRGKTLGRRTGIKITDITTTPQEPEWKNETKTILHCHGTTGNISHLKEIISLAYIQGYNILVYDYCGYGKSTGIPHPDTQYINGEVIYNHMVNDMKIKASDIIIWGESLGGAVATHIASKYKCAALVLLSTFSSLDDLIYDKFPNVGRWLSNKLIKTVVNTLPSKDKIKMVKSPIVIMHSKVDGLIPIESANRLYNSIEHDKKLFIEINGPHSNPTITVDNMKELFEYIGVNTENCEYASGILDYIKYAM